MSLPSRERGLKYEIKKHKDIHKDVAPFAGAWIEIPQLLPPALPAPGRSLRGSVD